MLEHHNPTPLSPVRVVVLGAGGFVGGAVMSGLSKAGIPALGLTSADVDLLAPDSPGRLAQRLMPKDALVFVSALTPDRGRDGATFMKNLTMAQHVCEAVADAEIAHLVYIGSDAVYHDDANPVNERSGCQPSGFHGMMHLAREMMLAATVKVPLALLRPSLLYGEADTHNGYGPNRFRRLARDGKPITLFGEGEEMRDHVLVDDLAEIVRLTLTHRSAGVLNVATGRSVSFRDAAQTVSNCFATPVPVTGTLRANPITHRHFDITDGLKTFPHFRYTPFAQGVALAHQRMMEQG